MAFKFQAPLGYVWRSRVAVWRPLLRNERFAVAGFCLFRSIRARRVAVAARRGAVGQGCGARQSTVWQQGRLRCVGHIVACCIDRPIQCFACSAVPAFLRSSLFIQPG